MPKRKLSLPPLKELFRQRDDLVGLSAAAQLLKQLGEAVPLGTLDEETIAKALSAYYECEGALCDSEHDKQALSDAVLGGIFVGLGFAGTPFAETLQAHQRNAGLTKWLQSEKWKHLDEIGRHYLAHRDKFNDEKEAAEHYEVEYENRPEAPKYDAILKHIRGLK